MGKKSGRAIMIESSKKVAPWRDAVAAAGKEARDGALPMDGPLYVRMVFTIVRPRGHYRTGKNAHLLRDGAPARPCVTPDVSKLARSTEDALTAARVWEDDARVVEYTRLAKVYANEDPEALDASGALIVVSSSPSSVL
jgi:Holliday junction resolvase RusA-like endonuclease